MLDFTKAFDTVAHERFLKGQPQRVVVEGEIGVVVDQRTEMNHCAKHADNISQFQYEISELSREIIT